MREGKRSIAAARHGARPKANSRHLLQLTDLENARYNAYSGSTYQFCCTTPCN